MVQGLRKAIENYMLTTLKIKIYNICLINIFLFFYTIPIILHAQQSYDPFEKVWSYSKNSYHPSDTVQASGVVYKNYLLSVDLDGNVLALDLVSGNLLWTVKIGTPSGRRGFYIDQKNGYVYINGGTFLYKLRVLDGTILKKIEVGMSQVEPIIVGNDAILFNHMEGNISRVDIEKNILIWKLSLGSTARIWSPPALSNDQKIAYIATSNPGSLVAGETKVKGKDYSSSLVAIDISKGNVVFSYQDVFKDIWDYDVTGRPLLIDNYRTNDGREINAVFQLTKTGNIIALDARDGTEIYKGQTALKFVDTNKDEIEGVSQFQREYLWPERFSDILVEPKDLRLSEMNSFKLRHAKFGEFIPPSVDYDVVIKGLHGGAEWFGGQLHSKHGTNYLVVPYNDYAWILRLEYTQAESILDKLCIWFIDKIFRLENKILRIFKSNPDTTEKTKFISDDNDFSGHRWSQSEWRRKSYADWDKYWTVRESIHYATSPFSYNKTYSQNCASCHGKARLGDYQSEHGGDGYIPSLLGYTLTKKFKKFNTIDALNAIHLDKQKLNISQKDYNNMNNFFNEYDNKQLRKGNLIATGFWQMLAAKDGYPANNPPWGGIGIVNLETGKLEKKILIGDNKVNGVGLPIFGGISSPTTDNLIAATGTPDSKAFIIDLDTNTVIQKIKLSFTGSAPPLLTKIGKCEAFVFIETGGRFAWNKKRNGFVISLYKKKSCDINSM